jgi:hypothetical protein
VIAPIGGVYLIDESYALCFSSAEDAAEGPSEAHPEPSAEDLVTSAVAN